MQQPLDFQTPGERLWEWFENRNYWLLVPALPAFLGFAGVITFAIYHFAWRPDKAEAACVEMGGRGMANGQYQRAAIAYQSLLRLRGQTEAQYVFRIAQCFSELDRRPEAAAMMSVLAPPDQPGLTAAHLFLAGAILSAAGDTAHGLQLAESHLQPVLRAESQNADAHELMGRLLLQRRQWEEARKHLTEVVNSRPELTLALATTFRQTGDESSTRAWASRAEKHFSARCLETLGDDTPYRLGWGRALALLRDFPASATVLETGRERTGNAAYGPAIADVCADWAVYLQQEQPTDRLTRLRALQRGFIASISQETLHRELIRVLRSKGAENDAWRKAASELLVEGREAQFYHLVLACLEWQRGEPARAETHFKAAFAGPSALTDMANNLAYHLAETAEGDKDLALTVMQALLKRFPNSAAYRDTRGLVLLRQGKAEAAVEDLDFAVRNLPDPTASHRALSEAYTKLGRAELAAEHARLADAAAAAMQKRPRQ